MHKSTYFLWLSLLLSFTCVQPVLAQENIVEEIATYQDSLANSDTVQAASTTYKFVGKDSLYLLQDNNSQVNNAKFEAEFKKKYKGKEDFTYEKVEEKTSLLQRMKQAIQDWFFRNFIRNVDDSINVDYVTVVFRVLGFLVIGLLIFYLVKAFIQQDVYWLFKKKAKKIQAFENITAEDFSTTDFEKIVQDLIQQQEYRLAIRMYYLWLLQRLQEEGKINWAPEKTNADYTYELQEESEKEQFAYLSYLYNTIWYGEYELIETDFFKAKNSFDQKLKTK